MTRLPFQVCLLGDTGVGKTSLLRQYTDNSFRNESATIGPTDCRKTTITVEIKDVELWIWDTSGQERFRALTTSYYRGAHGIIIVFDVTELASFRNLTSWLGEIDKHADENVSRLLVGNKCDLKTMRMVDYATAKRFAKNHRMDYIETSAKDAQNVERSFVTMATEILQRFDISSTEDLEPNGAFKIDQNDPVNQNELHSNGQCCGQSKRGHKDFCLEDFEAADKSSDNLLEMCLVGNLGVGKSCLLERFADDTFAKRNSIGVDFRNINVSEKMKPENYNFERKKRTKIRVWDTVGDVRYRPMMFEYISRSQGIIIVYDITKRSTFTSVRYWLDKIDQHAPKNVSKLLVGTKSDLTKAREVDYRTAEDLAASMLIPFLETSALIGSNVHEVFVIMTSQIKEQLRRKRRT